MLSLQRGITYGPVQSRRLGRSLGINVTPPGRKVCNFDCRYCQYGLTDSSLLAAAAADFPTVPAVLDALEAALARLEVPPDYLTFSGNGEPTLHPEFGALVVGVNALRDRLAPQVRTAVLSNSSRVGNREVREALGHLDVRIMKLDAGTEECFARYNRPVGDLTLAAVVEGLEKLRDTTIQTLFTEGPTGNLKAAEIEAWLQRVAAIRPREVQLYTLDREAPCKELSAAAWTTLVAIRERVLDLGLKAHLY